MKILVGTLKTNENEFEACCKSIQAQSYKHYDHQIIENLGSAEAHDKLYSTFQNTSNKYDLLVKIDADMVIEDKELFDKIVSDFKNNKYLDHLFIPTYDHFVCRNLGGVNVYRNSVRWHATTDNYFPDRVHKPETIRESKKWVVPEDKPLIHHCPNPSSYQASHFGLHRSIKAFQFGEKNKIYQKSHWMLFNDIKRNYYTKKDRRLLLTLGAARYVISHKLNDSYINYSNENIYKIYEEINRKNDDELYDYAVNNIYMRMLNIFGMYSYYLILIFKK